MPVPTVLTHPQSTELFWQGFRTLAKALACTLGPTQGTVISTAELKPTPEILTDAATIARRVIALPDRGQDVGAMLLRNMVWRVHQRVGDGGAMTAVLAQGILESARRCVLAGANPMVVLRGMRRATDAAVKELSVLSRPAQAEGDLYAIAESATGHPDLSFVLAEMFDLLGADAFITVEDYLAPYLEREYLEGGVWQGKIISPYLVTAPSTGKGILPDCRVALFAGRLESVEDVLPALELAAKAEPKHLFVAAQSISGEALNTLVATNQKGELKVLGVNLMRVGERLLHDWQDLALLTGARLFRQELGESLRRIQEGDLGRARRVEAGAEQAFVVRHPGGSGALREEIERLQRQVRELPFSDPARAEFQMRLGRLSGSSGILKVGAISKAERSFLLQKSEQGIRALRAAMEEGVLPGGGVAYLRAAQVLNTLDAKEEDERMGIRAVAKGLEAPFYQILANANHPAPAVVAADLQHQEDGTIYDVIRGQFASASQAGVLDATKTLRVALETASSGAAMALSTDTIVLQRNPMVSDEP